MMRGQGRRRCLPTALPPQYRCMARGAVPMRPRVNESRLCQKCDADLARWPLALVASVITLIVLGAGFFFSGMISSSPDGHQTSEATKTGDAVLGVRFFCIGLKKSHDSLSVLFRLNAP